jgi:hypothetical protein
MPLELRDQIEMERRRLVRKLEEKAGISRKDKIAGPSGQKLRRMQSQRPLGNFDVRLTLHRAKNLSSTVDFGLGSNSKTKKSDPFVKVGTQAINFCVCCA